MTLERGVIRPAGSEEDESFVGWAPAPAVDRRFLFGAMPALIGAIGAGAYAVASNQQDPGEGVWLTGATHVVAGTLFTAPYPMLRIADAAAPSGQRTVLVVSVGKCTSGLKLDEAAGRAVTARGVLIQRRERQMLEVPPFLDQWLAAADGVEPLREPAPESLGSARLAGMIMDSKCFFGVMRPSIGRTHKACAALCIRGGIPPSFWVRDGAGRERVLLMTDAAGRALGDTILPLVAEAVEAEGEIVRVGDLLQFRADAKAYRLVA